MVFQVLAFKRPYDQSHLKDSLITATDYSRFAATTSKLWQDVLPDFLAQLKPRIVSAMRL